MTTPLATPVAFLIFNRPETTQAVFERIAVARPATLLVVADGPRADRPDEGERCALARAVIQRVDWPCDVRTHFSEVNLGCRRRISSGLDWVFRQVEEAILLEDDCLPDPSFFPFCAEMLARYCRDERVFMVSGSNFLFGRTVPANSYYFSRFIHIWGWATWRRAWQHYDVRMQRWPEVRDTDWLQRVLAMPGVAAHFRSQFDRTHRGEIDTWDYQWAFSTWLHDGLAIAPARNLVKNIGMGAGATNTLTGTVEARAPWESLEFPLRHPPEPALDAAADRMEARLLGISKPTVLERWQRSVLKRLGRWP